MANIPKYGDYPLFELYNALNSIRGDLYPHTLAALETEIASRKMATTAEIEECYFILNKDKHPDHARRLYEEIEGRGGFTLGRPVEITEENKYRTFWPRFWAGFLDAFVVGLPLMLLLLVIDRLDFLDSTARAYIDQVSQLTGIAYFVVMHAIFGQTVGKMVTRVKIWDLSETKVINLRQSVIREVVPAIFVCVSILYFLGFGVSGEDGELTEVATIILISVGLAQIVWWIVEIVTMLFSKKRRALHDIIAGTVVTRVP